MQRLYKKLRDYAASDYYPFHMPGHKRNPEITGAVLPYEIDITEIEGFDDLARRLGSGDVFMAMGNSDVPVGQYTSEILKYYNLDEEKLANEGLITYCSNVKEVQVQVSESAVDCGVIYATDAFSAGLEVVDSAREGMCSPVIYPAAVINSGESQEEAKAFLEYLKGDEAMAVFESVGFSPAF